MRTNQSFINYKLALPRVPVANGEAQPLLHGSPKDLLVRIVIAEGEIVSRSRTYKAP